MPSWRPLALALCIVLLACAALAREARAALLPTYDLASLAFLAEHVVRATRMSERPGPDGATITTLRVDEVLAGTLSREAPIDLDLGLYGLHVDPFDPKSKHPEPRESVVLFLVAARSGSAATGPSLAVVSSGMRVVIDGRVHRFEQWSNPGGYVPVPQGPEPCHLAAFERCGEGVDRARFERDLAAAIERARLAREVLGRPGVEPSLALAFIGAPAGALDADTVQLGGYVVDAIADRADEVVRARGALPDLLEAAARRIDRGLSLSRPITRITRAHVEQVATARHRATRERVAALGLLAEASFAGGEPGEPSFDALAPLLDDPVPLVRSASIAALSRDRGAGRFASWLRRRWAKETDARVLFAILRAADAVGALPFPEPPGAEPPFLHAERSGRTLQLGWASGHTPPPRIAALALEWGAPTGVVRRELDRSELEARLHQSTLEGGAALDLSFDGLAAGVEHELEVEVTLTDDRGPVLRRAKLGSLVTPAASSAAAPSAPTSSTAPASDAPGAAAPTPSPPPSGCGCRVGRALPATGLPSVGFAFALTLATLGARRARRGRASRACSRST